jgi:dipeptidyl aminopeptidase/acylaminoacyl peptidase
VKPDDIYRLPLVGDPRVSPDGSLVAFVVTRAVEETNDYTSAIWLVPSDGSAPPRRLTSGAKRDNSPRWSPDGASLAFCSNRENDAPQLYVMPMDGGEPCRLTDLAAGVSSPVWSPDGSHVAFTSIVRGPAWDEEDDKKRPPRTITQLDYKADGRGFVEDQWIHVFVVGLAGGSAPRRITEGDFDHSDPAWSPDGTSLALAAHRDPDERGKFVDVWLFSLDGAARCLTAHDAMYMKPSWSPDGSKIAAHVYPDTKTAPWNTHIAIIDVASGAVEVPTKPLDMQCGPYFHNREPIWLTDDRLLFAADRCGNTHMWLLDLAGEGTHALHDNDVVVTSHDFAGGAFVRTETTATRPAEVFRDDVQLTDFASEFSGVVPVSFLAGEVEGWAMPPRDAQPGTRYPTLLFIHGGPFTQYGNAFFDEFQVAAAAGYAVVYSNPRGSSGYGDDWGRAIRGPISGGPGWGTVDYEDLMAVMDEAVRRFDFVDGERLGVLGGSYGGFMTAWTVTRTDRFKAACAERGIYNAMSAVGTSDGLWSSDSVWGGDPYAHPDLMMEASPITYAENITTPLLLLHSDQDHRCPVEQAEQMFTRLRLLGREVKLVRFPHGTHDLSRNGLPRHRVFRFETILHWFDSHL